ncbi:carboxypeptidase regulatory-like domain-containing protein [Candidatus Nitrospira neomarina]|uniref:Carboxypeptidase regulatory-like domain-containing protein n=1 Tax=Candidatus Nitrospira neomarina TaxID=3020899 RepID=A0AA96JV36_9BACT|nr:carboxypeptidase regulatory-like domain-containing protein [Candidatus Nitrospira neomarina]WNM61362.1 carboxypeptidase regulatory-like domain-containing protein [Candidatus Nitrospira neomarina]
MNNSNALWILLASLFLVMDPGASHAYEVGNVQTGGSIHGRVSFLGSPPEPLHFKVEKNPEICGQERSLMKVEARDGFLAGAVVVLEGINTGKPFSSKTFTGNLPGTGEFRYLGGDSLGLQVKTHDCNFGPFTGVIAANEAVRFQNQDSIKHVLHSFVSKDSKGRILRTVHNQDLQPHDEIAREFPSDKMEDGVVVRIICNRHDFMQNWLYVVDNPYYAISDEKGRFTIDQIPPGTYTLLVRHPVLGEQRQEVTIDAQGYLQVEFAFVDE